MHSSPKIRISVQVERLIPRFGRSVPEFSEIISEVSSHIFDNYGYLLRSLDQPDCLQRFADAIYGRGSALSNCWGFLDGTVRPIARPGEHQRVLYNGHKRVHALKFQSVVAPNGMMWPFMAQLVRHFICPENFRLV